MTPRIGITIGDFNGIGPEIILKFLSKTDLSTSTPVVISPLSVLEHYRELTGIDIDIHVIKDIRDLKEGSVNVYDNFSGDILITPGSLLDEVSGRFSMHSISTTIDLCISKSIDAMVTAPISKEAVNQAGFKIPGHTEFLAEKTNSHNFLMMLVSGALRVALVTTHIPISEVSKEITSDHILKKLHILNKSLKNDFKISDPKIAVFGLNPHAGDGGVIGMEEIDIISPALETARFEGIRASGPFPADGFFGRKLHLEYDAILAMYHDQGLAPFKLLSFGKGVNFTAGLPIIRTSPDHGTAYNIAGQGIADPSSFSEAYTLALELTNNKHEG